MDFADDFRRAAPAPISRFRCAVAMEHAGVRRADFSVLAGVRGQTRQSDPPPQVQARAAAAGKAHDGADVAVDRASPVAPQGVRYPFENERRIAEGAAFGRVRGAESWLAPRSRQGPRMPFRLGAPFHPKSNQRSGGLPILAYRRHVVSPTLAGSSDTRRPTAPRKDQEIEHRVFVECAVGQELEVDEGVARPPRRAARVECPSSQNERVVEVLLPDEIRFPGRTIGRRPLYSSKETQTPDSLSRVKRNSSSCWQDRRHVPYSQRASRNRGR